MSAALSNGPVTSVNSPLVSATGKHQHKKHHIAGEEASNLFRVLVHPHKEPRLRDIPGDLIADVLAAADPVQVERTMKRFASADDLGSESNVVASAEKPMQKLEAFLLRTSIESMLPSEDGEFYGKSPGAGVWRSMAADQFASLFAERGGIGLARSLDARIEGSVGVGGARGGAWPYFQSPGISSYEPPSFRESA